MTKEADGDIYPNDILQYVWRSFERLAALYYEVLAFKTSKELLDRAEDIVKDLYEEDSFEYLDFMKKKSLYYKKYQKNGHSLKILKDVLKTERAISSNAGKEVAQVEETVAANE